MNFSRQRPVKVVMLGAGGTGAHNCRRDLMVALPIMDVIAVQAVGKTDQKHAQHPQSADGSQGNKRNNHLAHQGAGDDFINKKAKEERFEILSEIAKHQLDILNNAEKIKLLGDKKNEE